MSKKKKYSKNEGIISDKVEAKNLAVGKGASAVYNENTSSSGSEIEALLQQLKTALETVPEEHQEMADFVLNEAEALKESAEKDSPKPLLEIKAEGLKKAAETLKTVTPTVLAIASQVIAFVLKSG